MNKRELAYLGPFFVFLAFLLLMELVAHLGDGSAQWFLAAPSYWIFPLQTVVCAVLLYQWRRQYTFRPFSGWLPATAVAAASLALWISPQWLFHAAPRTEGFDPGFFGGGSAYAINLSLRLVRMVIIVPLVEEIFWRGWLLRFLVRDDFHTVPFGTFTWKSFLLTTAGFCLEHQLPDWPAALLTGALFNLVAYRTKSLAACIFTHALTNAALAAYLLKTQQWGFW